MKQQDKAFLIVISSACSLYRGLSPEEVLICRKGVTELLLSTLVGGGGGGEEEGEGVGLIVTPPNGIYELCARNYGIDVLTVPYTHSPELDMARVGG